MDYHLDWLTAALYAYESLAMLKSRSTTLSNR